MSQDLFAAFGASENDAVPASKQKQNINYNGSRLADLQLDEDDDFGDFEDASKPESPKAAAPSLPFELKKPSAKTGSHPFAGHMDLLFDAGDDEYDAGEDDLHDLSKNPEAAMEYSKRIIAQQEAGDFEGAVNASSSRPDLPASRQEPPRPIKDPNVLFDADDVSEEEQEETDDWGDFEGGTASSGPQASKDVPSLLNLDDTPTQSRSQKPPPKPQPSRPVPSATTNNFEEDDWADFEESSAPPAPRQSFSSKSPQPPSITNPSSPPPTTRQPAPALAPTNIPPPALLLSIFPSILSSANEALFTPLSKLDGPKRQTLLSHPATRQFLSKYITTSIVLGHVIAGRKPRWKRDQYLAQGMRIGPAGGKGGMKLAGVDRSETVKEEREVLDVVKGWRGQVGKVRSAVAGIGGGAGGGLGARLPAVPEISEQLPIKVLKGGEGGLVAPQACALCGLKREERVPKVDFGVEDSFGEWWIEGINMHLTCRDFWDEYKGKLRSK